MIVDLDNFDYIRVPQKRDKYGRTLEDYIRNPRLTDEMFNRKAILPEKSIYKIQKQQKRK